MSAEWQEFALTDLYDISSGLSKPAEAFGSGYPFVSFKDVFGNYFLPRSLSQLVESTEKERHSCSVKRGDVFLTRTSETMHELGMSSVALNDYPNATFNGFTKRLRPKENPAAEVHPEFIGYCLRSSKFRTSMLAFSTMSTRASLNNDMISRLNIKLPPFEIQKEIAKVLRSLDKKIHLNTQTNQTLESIAQAIFKSWFVDFEPVKAKMAVLESGGTREQAELAAMGVISGKSETELAQLQQQNPEHYQQLTETAALFPSAMVESELGEIPEGWEVKALDDVCFFQNGFAFSSKDLTTDKTEGTHKVFKMGNIKKGGGFNSAGSKDYFDLESNPKVGRYLIKKGDLLMCMTDMKNNVALLGHTALMPITDQYLVNQRVGLIRKSESHYLDYPFFYFQTNEENFIQDVRSRANSGVQVNLSTQGIKETLLVVPPESVHYAFNKVVKELLESIFLNDFQSDNLAELRDSLLPKLLSGEIDLTNLQREVA